MAKASTETRTRHTRQAAERKQTLTTLGLDGAPGQGAFKIKTQRSKASQGEPALAQSCRWTLRGGGIQVPGSAFQELTLWESGQMGEGLLPKECPKELVGRGGQQATDGSASQLGMGKAVSGAGGL